MKKIIWSTLIGLGLIASLLGVSSRFGSSVQAIEGAEGIGIIVKSGTKMDTILPQFTVTEKVCSPGEATSTPDIMCPIVLYQDREVKVFYTAPQNLTVSQSPFRFALGAFPFSGSIEYKNASVPDETKEARLIQFMQSSGAVGDTYTIIYEQ